jgi:hypothetical protein
MNAVASPVSSRRIPLKSITLDQAEGETGKLIKGTVFTWLDAEQLINNICMHAPEKGGYWKVDFRIEWLSGEVYAGRYDAAHPNAKAYDGTLSGHCRHHLEFVSGLHRPEHIPEADYNAFLAKIEKEHPGSKDDAYRMLTTLALTDDAPQPQRVTPTVAPQQVATINSPTTMDSSKPTTPALPATTPTTGDSAMTTATSTPTNTAAPQMSAKDAHAENVRINGDKPLKAVIGDTFPIKGLLYCMGGKWDGTAKTWLVPEHKHAEAQRILDERAAAKAKPAAKAPATVQSTPAPAAPVKAAPKADLKVAKPVSGSKAKPTSLESRLDFALRGVRHIAVDSVGTSAEPTLAQVVKLLEGLIGK